ncbi:MAG: V-type ATP synthase subunit E [Firmicutes bacterium]|nr:V-type ATP synthase subunit E [Bacillota bacterium]
MDRVQERLISFEKTVNQEVNRQKAELEDEIEKETADRLAAIRAEYQKVADEKFSRSITQVEKQVNGDIWVDSVEAKKKILDKKSQIVTDIINAAMSRINDFINFEAYEGYLIQSIREAMTHINNNVTIYLTSHDKERFSDILEAEFQGKIDIQINDEIIGGCIAEDEDGAIVDNSISDKIEKQRDLLMYNVGM